MTSETWSPVPGFEDYEVSDLGRVRSYRQLGRGAHLRREVPRLLAPTPKRGGHLQVTLYRDKTRHYVLVHRLVAEAFLGAAPFEGALVCHWNDVPTDNRLANLRWGTQSDNKLDAVRNGRNRNARKTHCKRGHAFTPENTYSPQDGKRYCRACIRVRREIAA